MKKKSGFFGWQVLFLVISLIIVTNYLTYVSVGFTERVIHNGCKFSPIRIFSDGILTNIKIYPLLPSSMVLDVKKRSIHGIYTGTSCSISYELTVSYGINTVSTKFTLHYTGL